MITREEMIGLLQILADLPSAETKQGRGVRRRVEEAIAALQAGRQSQQAQVEPFAYCHLDVNGKAKELCSAPCADDDPRDTRTVQALYKHPPSPSAVPDEAFNLIEAIRAELTWPGWRKTSSRDWVMDMVSELLSMLTASPAPEHSGDGNEMADALGSCIELIETICPIEGDTIRSARTALANHRRKQEEAER